MAVTTPLAPKAQVEILKGNRKGQTGTVLMTVRVWTSPSRKRWCYKVRIHNGTSPEEAPVITLETDEIRLREVARVK